MDYCVHCGSEIPDDADHCLECGAKRMEGRPSTLLDRSPRPLSVREDTAESGGNKFADAAAEPEPAGEYAADGYEYDETLGTGGFLGSLILMNIPIIGLLITLIWALGGSRRVSRQKLARAQLLFLLIIVVFTVVYVLFLSAFLAPYVSSLTDMIQGLLQ